MRKHPGCRVAALTLVLAGLCVAASAATAVADEYDRYERSPGVYAPAPPPPAASGGPASPDPAGRVPRGAVPVRECRHLRTQRLLQRLLRDVWTVGLRLGPQR